jgi:hypothetical protein
VPGIFDFSNRKDTRVWASTTADLTSVFNSRFTREDASELFRTGAQKINGIHRAFYLEGLAKQQRLTATGNTDYSQKGGDEELIKRTRCTAFLSTRI